MTSTSPMDSKVSFSSSRASYSNSLLPEAQEEGASFDRRPSERISATSPETEEVPNGVTTTCTTSSSVASSAPSLPTSSASASQALALPTTSTSISQAISATTRSETSPKITNSELLGILDQALEVSAPLSAAAPSLRDIAADPSMMDSTRDRLLRALQRLHAEKGELAEERHPQ